MKKEITSATILAYYNPKNQTVLQTNARIKGLGAYLLLDEKPYQSLSKKLEAECSISQLIEESSDMWMLKQYNCKKSDSMNNQENLILDQGGK